MENTRPLVSFIVSVFNTKNFDDLEKSIKSMLNQTYPNIEIIICDDCSTNGVYDFLLAKYSQDERVKIIRNEVNKGPGAGSNACLSVAKGSYIAKQDDDDYSDLNRIEKQVAFLDEHPEFSFVSAGFSKFDNQGIWSSLVLKPEPTKRDFRYHSQHVHASTLFKRDCLDAVGGYRVKNAPKRAEDYDLFMRLYAAGYRGYNLQEVLYYYNFPRNFTRKIKYKYKWGEARVRFYGFRAMKLPLKDYVYVLRPLIAGLIPEKLKTKIKSRRKK